MILTPKIEKYPYRGRGDTPLPPLGRFAPSHFPLQVGNHPLPIFEDLSTPLNKPTKSEWKSDIKWNTADL